jgi:hypothetical protein
MELLESKAFTEHLPNYLDDEGYRRLQIYLMTNPIAGKVIPGLVGVPQAAVG